MTRREFPSRIKVAAYERSRGFCERCTAPLRVGHTEYDHIVPDALGGEPTLENCCCCCTACHGIKTGKQDVPRIAKANRNRKSHLGAKKKSFFPGGRQDKWKRTVDGRTVLR